MLLEATELALLLEELGLLLAAEELALLLEAEEPAVLLEAAELALLPEDWVELTAEDGEETEAFTLPEPAREEVDEEISDCRTSPLSAESAPFSSERASASNVSSVDVLSEAVSLAPATSICVVNSAVSSSFASVPVELLHPASRAVASTKESININSFFIHVPLVSI